MTIDGELYLVQNCDKIHGGSLVFARVQELNHSREALELEVKIPSGRLLVCTCTCAQTHRGL